MQIEDETQNTNEPDFFGMDDSAIMGMQPPVKAVPAEPIVDPVVVDPVVVDPVDVVDPITAPVVVDPVVVTDPAEKDPLAADDKDPVTKKPAPKDPAAKVADPAAADVDPATKKAEETPATPIDYEAEYKKIMAPFKANGREITLQSPEEAIKLQQMGANYTKKMQALQPTLRLVKMLENNQLLDEGQLSYLIDLHQKKPEAIQKLLADSSFDPLKADVEEAAKYVPGDHRVSENEVQFQTVLDDVESTPTGPELIAEVAKQWDADSRQALFKDPRLLAEINNQKANGLYGLISDEIARRQVLGELNGVPFLSAYESVGNDMQAKGLLVPKEAVAPRTEPLVTRVVAPTPVVANSDRARAAMPTKVVPSTVKEEINPLGQSDEEFLKSMQGRL